MSILCAMFGHKAVKGWAGGEPYTKIRSRIIDGTGREHAYLWVECERCGEEFHLCNVHLPAEKLPPQGFGIVPEKTVKIAEEP